MEACKVQCIPGLASFYSGDTYYWTAVMCRRMRLAVYIYAICCSCAKPSRNNYYSERTSSEGFQAFFFQRFATTRLGDGDLKGVAAFEPRVQATCRLYLTDRRALPYHMPTLLRCHATLRPRARV